MGGGPHWDRYERVPRGLASIQSCACSYAEAFHTCLSVRNLSKRETKYAPCLAIHEGALPQQIQHFQSAATKAMVDVQENAYSVPASRRLRGKKYVGEILSQCKDDGLLQDLRRKSANRAGQRGLGGWADRRQRLTCSHYGGSDEQMSRCCGITWVRWSGTTKSGVFRIGPDTVALLCNTCMMHCPNTASGLRSNCPDNFIQDAF